VHIPDHAQWETLFARVAARLPEAFAGDRLLSLSGGSWSRLGNATPVTSPVDQRPLAMLDSTDLETAREAVLESAEAHAVWRETPLAERKERVVEAVDLMTDLRDDIALLLAWEIGKPWKLACADVDRCLDGVRWYLDDIDGMLERDADGHAFARTPLAGPVSNIASWNYPLSVLVHAELVQLLAGNAVIAKTPSQGGAIALTAAHAAMARAGLPATLLSGPGSALSAALIREDHIGALAFVGGRSNGGKVAAQLVDTGKRHMLEQEGLNSWGIWKFSDWDGLAAHLKKGFEYGKQRCTAYPRYVVQRDLVDRFLETYLPVVQSLRFGHPIVADDDGTFLDLDFGPLISSAKSKELEDKVSEAMSHGAVPLYRGSLDKGFFLDEQDTSAYHAPVTLLAPQGQSRLMHEEPFGPVDTIVVVDTESELLAQMNASNGALVASIACDDVDLARTLAEHVQAFKVGINKPRSRGDRAEPFGGRGASWRGAFVGGQHLVHAVTQGPDNERIAGNFTEYSRYPNHEL
jgi:acyl-CoA reductase-like NAD-dependent aldehyde dehydrogenase